MKAQRGLCIWNNCFMYFGGDFKNEVHSHHPLGIVIGVDGPFRYRLKNGEWLTADGILAWPNTAMQYDTTGRQGMVLFVDPETSDYSQVLSWKEHELTTKLGNGGVTAVPSEKVAEIRRAILPYMAEDMQLEAAKTIWAKTVKALAGDMYSADEPDPRVSLVMHAIRRQLTSLNYQPITTAVLQGMSALSESRLLHLFKQETGFTIRHYITSVRIAVAMSIIAAGRSATEAAHAAGFSDLAHFSRRFKSMFGMTPSFVTNTSDFIHIDFNDLDTQLTGEDIFARWLRA